MKLRVLCYCAFSCMVSMPFVLQADPVVQPPNLARGLVLHLPFEQNTVDISGNNVETRLIGNREFQAGVKGSCVSLDGESCVEVPDRPSLRLEQFSFCAWIYPFAPTARGRILEKGSNNSYWLYLEGDKAKTGYFDRGYVDLTSKSKVPAEKWTFLCTTFDGKELCVYVNGKLETKLTSEGKPAQSPESLLIGAKFYGKPIVDHFTGGIDELRVYNRALSEAEVKLLTATP